ncbi:MAG: polysaccharide deacetylase family protein [Eubacterium sp.]|nr:polysaccharide deacetylase family protein [Eubacterium sp.]
MKKLLSILLVLCLCLSMAACGKTSTGNKKEESQELSSATAEKAEPEEDTAAEEASSQAPEEADTAADGDMVEAATQTVPEESSSSSSEKMDVTNVDFDALAKISNASEEYGFSNKWRDDLNRPDGLEYYDALYGKYSAYNHIDTEEKIIYLTMDEGYENGYTPTILDTLKEKNVQAVFFVTEQFYDEHPELIQRMIDEGHIIGNHTCSHPASGMPSLGLKAEYKDIKKLNDEIYDTFGYQMKLFRFPQGNASKQSCALLQQMGYASIFWSFAYYDYEPDDQMNPTEALDRCLEYLHPGAIYLLHAISKTNTQILGDFIDGARQAGFEFGRFPVDDLNK